MQGGVVTGKTKPALNSLIPVLKANYRPILQHLLFLGSTNLGVLSQFIRLEANGLLINTCN